LLIAALAAVTAGQSRIQCNPTPLQPGSIPGRLGGLRGAEQGEHLGTRNLGMLAESLRHPRARPISRFRLSKQSVGS